jgi:hypothetical protein
VSAPLRRNAGLAVAALLASTSTLVCCVLPALMVALGAGATLAGLVTAVPQLVWLSEHKMLVFGAAAILLVGAAFAAWRARRQPCPTDPQLALSCMRLRRFSAVLLACSFVAYSIGAIFAFVLPLMNG